MSGKPKAVYRDRMNRYSDDKWLIWSNKWRCWYRSGCAGYTDNLEDAGIYDRATAARHYCGDVARKYRVTEPFPLSVVIADIRNRVRQLTDDSNELARKAQKLERLAASVHP